MKYMDEIVEIGSGDCGVLTTDRHTIVQFSNNSCAFSCDSSYGTQTLWPNLRERPTSTNCVVCADLYGNWIEELQEYLCERCESEFVDWKTNNYKAVALDFLREKYKP